MRISAGVSSRARAATSSIASGRQSSRRQISRTVLGGLECPAGRARSLDEERHRLLLERERGERELVLAVDAQPAAAGHEQLELRRVAEQGGERRRSLVDLLEVVDHEQLVAFAKVGEERGARVVARHLERGCDLGQDELGVAQRRQADEVDPVGKALGEVIGGLDRDTRLARPAGAGQGDQPRLAAQQSAQLSDLMPPPDQRRRGCGQAATSAQLCRLDRQRRILAQDRGLQLAQLRARLQAELLDQRPARIAEGGERIGLPAAAVERQHQLPP